MGLKARKRRPIARLEARLSGRIPAAVAPLRGLVRQAVGRRCELPSRGGFDIALPASYTPSKHDKKLEEVAAVVVGSIG